MNRGFRWKRWLNNFELVAPHFRGEFAEIQQVADYRNRKNYRVIIARDPMTGRPWTSQAAAREFIEKIFELDDVPMEKRE